MKARLRTHVFRRPEAFGGTVYVHHRNDFFFLDRSSFSLISYLTLAWREISKEKENQYRKLASLGICETIDPSTKEKWYRGPSFIGEFDDIPKVMKPLVLNCFTTAHCPLRCRYCHADDLMDTFRLTETDSDLDIVIRTAKQVDSIVAVLTGGDPLVRIDRTIRLIEGLGSQKALVLDTSGVPIVRSDIARIIPTLQMNRVHVRVSIDEFDPINSLARPINKAYVKDGRTAFSHAEETVLDFIRAGIPVSVQTVLSKFNDHPDNLFKFAQILCGWGVKHWVIHVTVLAGKAAAVERKSRAAQAHERLLPQNSGLPTLRKLFRLLEEHDLPLDLRVTNANPVRYSVFLVGSKGDLFTEGLAKTGKKIIFAANNVHKDSDIWKDVDQKAHTMRYANWIDDLFAGKDLSELSFNIKE